MSLEFRIRLFKRTLRMINGSKRRLIIFALHMFIPIELFNNDIIVDEVTRRRRKGQVNEKIASGVYYLMRCPALRE